MAKLQKLWLAAFAAVAAFGVDFLSRNGYIFLQVITVQLQLGAVENCRMAATVKPRVLQLSAFVFGAVRYVNLENCRAIVK